jgi:anti-sigma B factor antagonist
MPLEVQCTEKRPGVFVVACDGSLDTNTFSILESQVDRILARQPDTVIFDFKHLEYISSMGLRVVLKTNKVVKGGGGVVHLMHLQPQIKKVFEIIQALPSLGVFASIKEMDQYLDAMQSKVVSGG